MNKLQLQIKENIPQIQSNQFSLDDLKCEKMKQNYFSGSQQVLQNIDQNQANQFQKLQLQKTQIINQKIINLESKILLIIKKSFFNQLTNFQKKFKEYFELNDSIQNMQSQAYLPHEYLIFQSQLNKSPQSFSDFLQQNKEDASSNKNNNQLKIETNFSQEYLKEEEQIISNQENNQEMLINIKLGEIEAEKQENQRILELLERREKQFLERMKKIKFSNIEVNDVHIQTVDEEDYMSSQQKKKQSAILKKEESTNGSKEELTNQNNQTESLDDLKLLNFTFFQTILALIQKLKMNLKLHDQQQIFNDLEDVINNILELQYFINKSINHICYRPIDQTKINDLINMLFQIQKSISSQIDSNIFTYSQDTSFNVQQESEINVLEQAFSLKEKLLNEKEQELNEIKVMVQNEKQLLEKEKQSFWENTQTQNNEFAQKIQELERENQNLKQQQENLNLKQQYENSNKFIEQNQIIAAKVIQKWLTFSLLNVGDKQILAQKLFFYLLKIKNYIPQKLLQNYEEKNCQKGLQKEQFYQERENALKKTLKISQKNINLLKLISFYKFCHNTKYFKVHTHHFKQRKLKTQQIKKVKNHPKEQNSNIFKGIIRFNNFFMRKIHKQIFSFFINIHIHQFEMQNKKYLQEFCDINIVLKERIGCHNYFEGKQSLLIEQFKSQLQEIQNKLNTL